MIGEKIGHFLNLKGTNKVSPMYIDMPAANTFGPNGIISMIEVLADKKWNIEEDEKEKAWDMELNLNRHMRVFEVKHSIHETKTGKFSIQQTCLHVELKKKGGALQHPPKVRIHIKVQIRGQIKKADGKWEWLRSD